MPKNSNNDIVRIEKDISQLMQQGKSSGEIMDILGIPLRTFRRYTAAIHKQNQIAWYSLVRDELATELLRLRASLEESYHIALAMAEDPECPNRLEALQQKDDCRLSQVHLIVEGITYFAKVEGQQQPKYHKVGQNKIMMQPHP